MTHLRNARRKNERGVTLVLVALSLLVLMGMAALAVDVSTLYVAHGEAQRAADAAALAGARVLASSGYTSVSTPSPSVPAAGDVCLTSAVPGADAAANRLAEAVAAQNLIAGQPAAVQKITCDVLAPATNPRITVTVRRTGLPTFFGRVWGGAVNSVTARATAEAYNPSASTASIQGQIVKPWLIPNCDPSSGGPAECAAGGGRFVANADGTIQNNGSFVGKTITLIPAQIPAAPNVTMAPPGARTLDYYAIDVPMTPPPACPSTAGSCSQVGSGNYHDNIACASAFQFSCGQLVGLGQPVTVDPAPARTDEGVQCLIHAAGQGPGADQDGLLALGGPPDGTPPITISGGNSNPNPSLRGATSISRSDSTVTIPIYHNFGGIDTNLCPGGACNGTGTIVGFLQLGINQNVPAGSPPAPGKDGKIEAVIMNVAGCNPGAGANPVSGGGVSPIPVRLITTP